MSTNNMKKNSQNSPFPFFSSHWSHFPVNSAAGFIYSCDPCRHLRSKKKYSKSEKIYAYSRGPFGIRDKNVQMIFICALFIVRVSVHFHPSYLGSGVEIQQHIKQTKIKSQKNSKHNSQNQRFVGMRHENRLYRIQNFVCSIPKRFNFEMLTCQFTIVFVFRFVIPFNSPLVNGINQSCQWISLQIGRTVSRMILLWEIELQDWETVGRKKSIIK